MSCKCIKTIKISSITSTNDTFMLNPSVPLEVASLENFEQLRLIIRTKIPSVTTLVPVKIKVSGAENINLYCKNGNYIYRDQLKSRVVYPIVFGDDPNHFEMLCPICKTCGKEQINYCNSNGTFVRDVIKKVEEKK